MKTTKYILLTAVGMLLIGGSCSETYDIYPEEYSKVVRLKSRDYSLFPTCCHGMPGDSPEGGMES